MTARRAVFPGTFDPVTLGHVDVLLRALNLFDSVVVAVASSDRHFKQTLFSVEERVEMIRESIPRTKQRAVQVVPLQGLLVDFARSLGIQAIVRGLRFFSDFEYEYQMAAMNQRLWPRVDTIFLMPAGRYSYVNSTLVKEIGRHGGNLKDLVAPPVAARLRERLDRPAKGAAAPPSRRGGKR